MRLLIHGLALVENTVHRYQGFSVATNTVVVCRESLSTCVGKSQLCRACESANGMPLYDVA